MAVTFCLKCLLVVGVSDLVRGFSSDQFETTRVRQWTEWYNTDSPLDGVGDDEGVANIRQRGFDICSGNSPINAVCRVAKQHSIVFNEQTAQFTDDILIIPCNEYGIICRNADQINRTCLDYEIRFECLEEKFKESTSVAVIGIAAGMSIVIPVICVIVMNIYRMIKRRRYRNNNNETGNANSDRGSQTSAGDLPPSYSDLFSDATGTGSQEHLITDSVSRDNVSLVNESGNVNIVQTSSTGTGSNRIQTIVTQGRGSDQRISVSSISDTVNNNSNPSNQSAFSRLRFPGLHLSIFDMFSTSLNPNAPPPSSPTSPDLSYIQTPPPTYLDAVKILEYEKSKLQNELGAEAKPSVE